MVIRKAGIGLIGTNGTSKALDTVEPSSGADEFISYQEPYTALVRVRGTAALLFHRWNNESVAEKAAAAKGSKAKKTDDVESYVYRNEHGEISIPGRYFCGSIRDAGRYIQDPRSPRKSCMDLFKAGIVPVSDFCSLGSKDWDYLDAQRVGVQRAGITRQRPAFNKGWKTDVALAVLVPEYISPDLLQQAITNAGRLVGVGDFRPTYGRYVIERFEIVAGVGE